jgi:hypothetical protein
MAVQGADAPELRFAVGLCEALYNGVGVVFFRARGLLEARQQVGDASAAARGGRSLASEAFTLHNDWDRGFTARSAFNAARPCALRLPPLCFPCLSTRARLIRQALYAAHGHFLLFGFGKLKKKNTYIYVPSQHT